MANGKEKTQRRVYVLPAELVERILAFQMEVGLSSEVEAARRLLDDALKSRDTFRTLVTRFVSRLKETRIPAEIAKDVLVGHPLVQRINFKDGQIEFGMKDGNEVHIWADGKYDVYDEQENRIDFGPKPQKRNTEMDDDIPF
jgi:hypothetical protein